MKKRFFKSLIVLLSIILGMWAFLFTVASADDFSITGVVTNVNTPDDQFATYLSVTIGGDFQGDLPDDIHTITITAPTSGELTSTKEHFIYYPQWRMFFLSPDPFFYGLSGQPEIGEYTFEVNSTSGETATDTDTHSKNVTIPIPDKTTFSPAQEAITSRTPTFSWDPVDCPPDITCYYRLLIYDQQDNRVFATKQSKGENMFSHTLYEVYLNERQTYLYQVRVHDSGNWLATENRADSEWLTFIVGEKTFPIEFVQVSEGGFGDPGNLEDHNHCVFGDWAYIGTYNNSGGEIWTSSDGTTWIPVADADGGFGNQYNTGIGAGQTAVFNGYLYSGTTNMTDGAELWRYRDGETWERVLADWLGDPNNFGIYHLVEFKGALFCETNNATTGTEIWRFTDEHTGWEQVNTDGFGHPNSLWCGLYVIDDSLYATVFNHTTGAQIWRTDNGTVWSPLVEDGFGDLRNFWCRLTKFKDRIYASTRNWSGGEVWRSSDGSSWERIIDEGFGNPYNVYMTIHNPISSEDFLYIGTRNDATGGELWRTFDGVTWTQLACCGFENPNNFRLKPFSFGNELYVATCNHATGMEVWKEIPNTPPGDDIAIEPVDDTTGTTPVTITFDQVTEEGTTSLVTLPEGDPEPVGFKLGDPPTYYEITTTAEVSGPIEVCINYSGVSYDNEDALRLYHYENGNPVDVTTSLDTTNDQICGTVDSLSQFAMMEPAYQFVGFLSPLENPPVVNMAKAGRTIPVKFQLIDEYGSYISDLGAVTGIWYQATPCGGTSQNEVYGTDTSGSSGLRYDMDANQFIYTWKTEKGITGCFSLIMELYGFDQHVVDFELK